MFKTMSAQTLPLQRLITRAQIGFAILAILLGIAIGALLFLPAVPQKLAYHGFHDARMLLGIPNAMNVLSNAAFAIVGCLGLALIRRASAGVIDPRLKPAYATLFAGMLLTALGSAIYHWNPSNASLIWDRLPMAVAFMALFAAVLGERINPAVGRAALWPLVAFGVASVVYWAAFDDLRPYGIVQFYPILAIPVLIACMPRRAPGGGYLMAAIGCYVGAKFLEEADGWVFGFGGLVSGHTLKHLAAAFGAWLIYRMLRARGAATR